MRKKKAPNLLELDENFIPMEVTEGDECFKNGIIVWNITKMEDYINDHQEDFELTEVSVKEFHSSYSCINIPYLESVDTSRPIILAEMNPGKFIVIDGHHRLTKAHNEGKETMPAYKVKAHQHIPFMTTECGYKAFVKYWNLKAIGDEKLQSNR